MPHQLKIFEPILILVLVPIILYVASLSFLPLMEPDEGRYSLIASEMNQSGDYVTPHLMHVVYLEKPPLASWFTALTFRVFGKNELASRLFSGLCAWGCIILVFLIGRHFHDPKTGLYGAAILTTCLYHMAMGHLNILDMPLAFFVCAATWFGYRTLTDPIRQMRWRLLFYGFAALGFLTKGLIGIVFPVAILTIWLLWMRRWRDLFVLVSPAGIVLFSVIVMPWLILVQQANPDFLWFFFVREQFLRYTTALHGHDASILFFIPFVIIGLLPWLIFLPKAWLWQRKEGPGAVLFSREQWRFLITWAGFIFIFFSLSSSKLIPYIAPMFPPLAVIMGHVFRGYEERLDKSSSKEFWRYYPPILLTAGIFFGIMLVPLLLDVRWEQWWPWIVVPTVLIFSMSLAPIWVERRFSTGWFLCSYLVAVLFFLSLIGPLSIFLSPYKSAKPVAIAIDKYLPRDQNLYQFCTGLYGIDFYNKTRTPVVDGIEELEFGIRRIPEAERQKYFPTYDEFYRLLAEQGELYCVTKHQKNLDLLKKKAKNMQILWGNGTYYLIHLKK